MNKFQYTDRIITREEIQNTPNFLYIFGDNLLRKGYGGQARVCRDEPNTFGIRVKKEPKNLPESFFTDREFFKLSKYIKDDIAEILKLSVTYDKVFILSNIGKGRAKLPEKAPKLYSMLKQLLNELLNISITQTKIGISSKITFLADAGSKETIFVISKK